MNNITKTEKAFFNAAKAVSELSDHHYKLGCVVVDHHKIISSGHNSKSKYHRFQAELDQKFFNMTSLGPVHAEIDALLPLISKKADLTNATLYVYRQSMTKTIATARPCPRCMSIIKQLGIKKIKYTTYDGFATEKIMQDS